ncbi:hypothetical protein [Bradyrhizobium canariense]|uniref:hypothetical protein n=1 Tax=Bradyrhizobium canariense TaxID=255045 RepID=UPI001F0A6687|nr:hypothetical protein [Bradyrhizobium canariense]
MKLKLAAAMLAASLPLASMAFAQGIAPAELAVIDGCLKTAEKTGGFGGACVGLSSRVSGLRDSRFKQSSVRID